MKELLLSKEFDIVHENFRNRHNKALKQPFRQPSFKPGSKASKVARNKQRASKLMNIQDAAEE